ncbi:MAG: methyl-accepting chemotaxis protein [Thermodesulfobacteriota bacterium]
MSLIGDTKLSVKLSLAFFLVVAVFASIASYQIAAMDRLGDFQADGASRSRDAMDVLTVARHVESLYSVAADAVIDRDLRASREAAAAARDLLKKDVARVRAIADTEEEKKQAEDFASACAAYLDTIEKKLLPLLESGNPDMGEIRDLDARIVAFRGAAGKALERIVASVLEKSRAAGESFSAVHGESIRTAQVMSGAGTLLAVAVAAFLILSITRPLKKATSFALELAAGVVDKDLAVRQRDEVGEVCWSLRRIAETLRNVLAEFAGATDQIAMGRLRARGDAARFKGAYADLIGDANRMADSLVNYLDMVPAPIMTVDNDFGIQFMNQAGARVGSADPRSLQGAKCYEHFRTGDCRTPGCGCDRAIKANAPVDSATTANPSGRDLEITYTAIPIRNRKGDVVGAMEVVADQTEIKRAQQKMGRLADQAQGIAGDLGSAAEELSAQVEESSRGADIQRDRAGEAATAMEQMNSTVMAVARSASNAAKAADATQSKAREGSRNVEALVAAVLGVKSQMDALSANMAGLGKQAEGISGILNVISDIADQTNLLALNAAIEAARAGDAGRGFAVVADEVRKLAEKTMTATKEVGDAITAIQDGARRSIGETEKAAQTVTGSAETAQASGAALTEIVSLAEETADQVRAIATAAEQQSAASEQINRSTEEINRISTETAETMTQSAEAVVELARLAQELQGLISEMNA